MNFNPESSSNAQKTTHNKTDSVFAWLSLILAFLYCHTVPVARHPLGGFFVVLAAFITAFIVLGIKKVRLHPACILTSISALLVSAALILTGSGFLRWLTNVYCLASYCFLIYAAFGNRVEQGFSDYIYIDYFKMLFILPFCSIVSIFPAVFSDSASKGTRFVLKILVGIGIAIIPTALVFAFLSYDDGFMKILDDIFSFDPNSIPQWLFSFIFTVPFAMYGYGLYASSQKGVLKGKITAENCKTVHQKMRILPQITAVVATLPIIFLYVVFFISQWKYYISGFTGVLPDNLSHAEYARQGFFELCAVSVINLICIAAIAVFIGRGRKNKAVVLKLLTVIFCLCTLILISTAVAKLVMYIDYYGLTQKRIYAMWLMAVIAIVFLVIALGQFISKIRIVAMSCTVFIAMFIPLALCNVNALTAQYNTDRYLSGTLESVDTELMAELGDSAIPSLVKLANTIDAEKEPELKIAIDCILHDKKVELRDEKFSLFTFSIPSALAKSAIKDYEPIIPPAGTYRVDSYSSDSDYKYYAEDKPAPILTILPDRTGSISFEDQSYALKVENYQIVSDEAVFDIRYTPATEDYPAEMTLILVTDDDQYGRIYLTAE